MAPSGCKGKGTQEVVTMGGVKIDGPVGNLPSVEKVGAEAANVQEKMSGLRREGGTQKWE